MSDLRDLLTFLTGILQQTQETQYKIIVQNASSPLFSVERSPQQYEEDNETFISYLQSLDNHMELRNMD